MADEAPAVDATSTTTPAPANPSGPDPEVAAIGKVNEALLQLAPAAQQRVLRWAVERFGAVLPKRNAASTGGNAEEEEEPGDDSGAANAQTEFTDFAALYDASNPATESERALVAGYWFQVCQNQQDFDALNANKTLKHLGHELSNVTRALETLINHKPRYLIQTRKEGTSKQARKKYRVTAEGIKRVKQMLRGVAETSNGGQT